MKDSLRTHGWYFFYRKYRFAIFALALLSACFLLFAPSSTSALTTVPTKMNFQGRLTDSSGNIKANGTYNMRLRLYTVSTGGSPVWSEDRLVSASQGVTVTNGLFSIKLGDVTSLPASLFASGDLYLSVELPSPATATSASPSWTEGAMTPRNQMATSAYAYNAETLDGIDSASFAQIGASNLFSAAQTINIASTGAFDVQNGSSVSVFKVDSSTSTVTLGTATNGSIFTATGVSYAGTARPTRTVTLEPEYAGATFRGDGSNNNGSLSSDFCSATDMMNVNAAACPSGGEEHNYYEWTTTQATAQDYDIYVRYRMPSDFDTGSITNLVVTALGTTANESAVLSIYENGSQCFTTGDVVTNGTDWDYSTTASPTFGTCTLVANTKIVLKISLSATQNQTVRVGGISYQYRSKF